MERYRSYDQVRVEHTMLQENSKREIANSRKTWIRIILSFYMMFDTSLKEHIHSQAGLLPDSIWTITTAIPVCPPCNQDEQWRFESSSAIRWSRCCWIRLLSVARIMRQAIENNWEKHSHDLHRQPRARIFAPQFSWSKHWLSQFLAIGGQIRENKEGQLALKMRHQINSIFEYQNVRC